MGCLEFLLLVNLFPSDSECEGNSVYTQLCRRKMHGLWITKAPCMKPTKQENSYNEEGTYCYFDMHRWKKAHKEFRVEYDKLEDIPQLPQNVTPGLHHGISNSCMSNTIS